jgi:trehalose 6-phosphate phosphatase
MQYLLSRASRPILTELSQQRTLCAFDFDGTLSPIADHPDRARLRVRTRNLLRRLATLYPCVVVSGRARRDVLSKLNGVNVARVIGNHGAEAEVARKPHQRIEPWKALLDAKVGSIPGVWVEDKGFSLAVHYRQSTEKAEARRRILAAARQMKGVRVYGGKQVTNFVAEQAPQKGDALAVERDRLRCNWVLFVGDDENDENAFALGGNVVPVRIGRKERSHARYYLRTQPEIDELLGLLVRLRKPVIRVSTIEAGR